MPGLIATPFCKLKGAQQRVPDSLREVVSVDRASACGRKHAGAIRAAQLRLGLDGFANHRQHRDIACGPLRLGVVFFLAIDQGFAYEDRLCAYFGCRLEELAEYVPDAPKAP
jgi:hypothetical protein